MNYIASVSEFFKAPKWMMNMLLGGVCVLIPFVGPIVIKGWLVTGFWTRNDERAETFPDFDFSNFGTYLERGLWPFLVTLATSAVLGVLLAVLFVPVMMVISLVLAGTNGEASGAAAGCMGAIMILFYALMIFVILFVLTPLVVRASITQDFAKSFDFTFVKQFAGLVWKEIVLSALFLMVASVLLIGIGMLAFCVGMYFALVPIYFASSHLDKQLYKLFIMRGGQPVPLSPKLDAAATL